MKHFRLWALLLFVILGTASVVYRHSFEFVFMVAGASCGLSLWRMFGRRGRRWLLFAVGIPVALALAGLDTAAESLAFPNSFHVAHQAADALFLGPAWLFSNIFAGWLTNPDPGTGEEPRPHQGGDTP